MAARGASSAGVGLPSTLTPIFGPPTRRRPLLKSTREYASPLELARRLIERRRFGDFILWLRSTCHLARQFLFAARQLGAELLKIHLRCSSLREHAVRLLLFLYVVLYHFRQHFHFGLEIVVRWIGLFDLTDQLLGTVMFDNGVVVDGPWLLAETPGRKSPLQLS